MPAYAQRIYNVRSTYEGLMCNGCVTYAERMPGVLGASMKCIDFMAGRFIGDLSN